MNFAGILEEHLGFERAFAVARDLHNSYVPFLSDADVRYLVNSVMRIDGNMIFEEYYNHVGAHKIVSDVIMALYPSEKTIKYYMAREHLDTDDEITAFEVKVEKSRLDLGVINGHSYGYEIKTELDNLGKLKKQIHDYSKAFEYVSAVIHPSHLDGVRKIVPEHCGIKIYRLSRNGCSFRTIRKSIRSPYLDVETQIANMTSRELEYVLKARGHSNIPSVRAHREDLIRDSIPKVRMNSLFKRTLKNRFRARWEHVKRNFDRINPVDVQAFFNSMSDPKWVYYRNSSMVYR